MPPGPAAGRLSDRYSLGTLLLICQGVFGALNLLFLTVHRFSIFSAVILAGIILLYSTVKAFVFVCASAGMFTLIKLDNINTSIALWFAIQAAGSSLSRIVAGVLLDKSLLPEIRVGGVGFTGYHFLFTLAGVLLLLGLIALPAICV